MFKKKVATILALSTILASVGVQNISADENIGSSSHDTKPSVIDIINLKSYLLNGTMNEYTTQYDYTQDGIINYLDLLACNKSVLNVKNNQSSEFSYKINSDSFGYYNYTGNAEYLILTYEELTNLESNGKVAENLSKFYTEDYFKDNILGVANIGIGSSSNKFEILDVTNKDNIISLNTKITTPYNAPDNFGWTSLAVEIPRSCYNGEKFVSNVKTVMENDTEFTYNIVGGLADYYDYNYSTPNLIITSYDELIKLQNNEEIPTLDAKYNKEYFKDNILCIAHFVFGDNGSMVKPIDVTNQDGVITFNTNTITYYGSACDVMTYYNFGIEIPKTCYNGETFEINNKEWYCHNYDGSGILYNIKQYKMWNANLTEDDTIITSYDELVKADITLKDGTYLTDMYDEEYFESSILCINIHCFECAEPTFFIDSIQETDDNTIIAHAYQKEYAIENTFTNQLTILEVKKDTYNGQSFETVWHTYSLN